MLSNDIDSDWLTGCITAVLIVFIITCGAVKGCYIETLGHQTIQLEDK